MVVAVKMSAGIAIMIAHVVEMRAAATILQMGAIVSRAAASEAIVLVLEHPSDVIVTIMVGMAGTVGILIGARATAFVVIVLEHPSDTISARTRNNLLHAAWIGLNVVNEALRQVRKDPLQPTGPG